MRRATAAVTVFSSKQAIVIGPTPPGTGVIAPATDKTSSYATSPTSRLSGKRLIPTSITVAPGETQSPRTISARPTAATRMSARRHSAGKSRVLECAIVTVAFAASNNAAIGRPTIADRPSTTARAPSTTIPLAASSFITPSGVQGTNPG